MSNLPQSTDQIQSAGHHLPMVLQHEKKYLEGEESIGKVMVQSAITRFVVMALTLRLRTARRAWTSLRASATTLKETRRLLSFLNNIHLHHPGRTDEELIELYDEFVASM